VVYVWGWLCDSLITLSAVVAICISQRTLCGDDNHRSQLLWKYSVQCTDCWENLRSRNTQWPRWNRCMTSFQLNVCVCKEPLCERDAWFFTYFCAFNKFIHTTHPLAVRWRPYNILSISIHTFCCWRAGCCMNMCVINDLCALQVSKGEMRRHGSAKINDEYKKV